MKVKVKWIGLWAEVVEVDGKVYYLLRGLVQVEVKMM